MPKSYMKSVKITKDQPAAVNRRARRLSPKELTMAYKTIHSKLNIEQYEPHKKPRWVIQ